MTSYNVCLLWVHEKLDCEAIMYLEVNKPLLVLLPFQALYHTIRSFEPSLSCCSHIKQKAFFYTYNQWFMVPFEMRRVKKNLKLIEGCQFKSMEIFSTWRFGVQFAFPGLLRSQEGLSTRLLVQLSANTHVFFTILKRSQKHPKTCGE